MAADGSTFDLQLPDGSMLHGIPEGTTKAQIISKLQANGHDVSGLTGDAAPSPTPAPAAAPAPGTPIPSAPRGHYNINHLGTPAEQTAGSALRSAIGTGEGILHGVTAPIGGAAGMLTGILGAAGGSQSSKGSTGSDLANELSGAQQAVSNALTYHPTTPVGQRLAGGIDRVLGVPGQLIQGAIANPLKRALPGASPEGIDFAAQNFAPLLFPAALKGIKAAPAALGRIGAAPTQPWDTAAGAPPPLPPRPGAAPATANPASFGADTASAARTPPINPQASPELNAALADSFRRGNTNPTAAERYALAERVTGRPGGLITPGEAADDVDMQRAEINHADQIPGYVEQKDAARQIVGQTMRDMRDAMAPSAKTDERAIGNDQMGLYRTLDNGFRSTIDDSYSHARTLLPEDAPVMASGTLLDQIRGTLKRKYLTSAADKDVMGTLEEAAEAGRPLTAGEFEDARTALADVARNGSGKERAAALAMRDAFETHDVLPGAQEWKAATDVGRAQARARFQRIEADPAYSAVVKGDAQPGTFMRDFGHDENGAQQMIETLGDEGRQNLIAHHLDRALESSRMGEGQTQNLAPDPFRKYLKANQGTLQAVLGGAGASALDDLQAYSRIITPDRQRIMGSGSNSAAPLVQAAVAGLKGGAEALPVVGGMVKAVAKGADVYGLQQLANRTMSRYGGLDVQGTPAPAAGSTPMAQGLQPPPARPPFALPPSVPRTGPRPSAPPPGPNGSAPPPLNGAAPRGGGPPPPPPRPAPTPASSAPPALPPVPPRAATPRSAPAMPPGPPVAPTPEGSAPTPFGPGQWYDEYKASVAKHEGQAAARRQQFDAGVQEALKQHGIQATPDFMETIEAIRGNTSLGPAEAVDRAIAHHQSMGDEIPRVAPTAPVQAGTPPPKMPRGRAARGSAIPPAPAISPANIIEGMRQVEPRVESGLSVKIPDLARQLGVTPQKLAEHLRPLGQQGVLDMHTHPWPDRLTAEDRAQLPSNGMGGYYDAVTLRRKR